MDKVGIYDWVCKACTEKYAEEFNDACPIHLSRAVCERCGQDQPDGTLYVAKLAK
jgi:hypothetical protein